MYADQICYILVRSAKYYKVTYDSVHNIANYIEPRVRSAVGVNSRIETVPVAIRTELPFRAAKSIAVVELIRRHKFTQERTDNCVDRRRSGVAFKTRRRRPRRARRPAIGQRAPSADVQSTHQSC